MLVAEEAARQRAADEFTLFASDIDAEALARARAGLYPGDRGRRSADAAAERVHRSSAAGTG